MAKKNTKKQQAKPKNTTLFDEKVLPQNILAVGERVEENKNVYILQKVYKEIHRFTQNKRTNESGGMLIGYVLEEFGKTNIIINGFIEAKYCEATPTTLKFTHETWDYVHEEMSKKYPKSAKIVGWIHTHPDFGIFLSEYDKFIHENFFKEDYQIAYVVDPIKDIEGFYFWINEKLEKCNGFYIYDKNGAEIDVKSENDEAEGKEKNGKIFTFKNFLITLMAIILVYLLLLNIRQNKEIEMLTNNLVNLNQRVEMLETQIALFGYPGFTNQVPAIGTEPTSEATTELVENTSENSQETVASNNEEGNTANE